MDRKGAEKFQRVLLWSVGIMAATVLVKKADKAEKLTVKVLDFVTGNKYTDFIKEMKPVAATIEAETGIKPLVLITQAAHESAWGLSELTRTANNLFGMTANADWVNAKKPTLWRDTREHSLKPPEQIKDWQYSGDVVSKNADGKGGTNLVVKRPFRAYATRLDSARDWARLMQAPRYAAALPFAKNGDLKNFAAAVKAAGYATDPEYPAKVVATGNKVEAVWA